LFQAVSLPLLRSALGPHSLGVLRFGLLFVNEQQNL
jgi:hypothetical protein